MTARHERAIAAMARAFEKIPFYKQRGAKLADASDVARAAPLLGRASVRGTLPKQWIDASLDARALLASGELEVVEIGASAEERQRVVLPRRGASRERLAAIYGAGLGSKTESAPRLIATLVSPPHGRGACHVGETSMEERVLGDVLTVNQNPDASTWQPRDTLRMLDELDQYAPSVLDADPFYLAALAAVAEQLARKIASPELVALSSFAPRALRRTIARATSGRLATVTGTATTGPVLVEREDGTLVSPDALWVEASPTKIEGVSALIVTTLDREAMPLVRYTSGELVRDATSEDGIVTAASYEGRVDEAIVRPDGKLVTLGEIDRAVASIEGLRGFQLVVRASEITLDALEATPEVEERARDAVQALVDKLRVSARRVTSLAAEPNGNYRVLRRETGALDPAAALGLA